MKILLIRFSAMGDVAMTVPVVSALAEQHPEADITFLSREAFAPLYCEAPENVHFRGVNLKNYSGFNGLLRLYRELKQEGYDRVVDLHDVLRTRVLRFLFRIGGAKVSRIHKGRLAKWRLTRSWLKRFCQLPTSFERYEAAIRRQGLDIDISHYTLASRIEPLGGSLADLVCRNDRNGETWIGIAPFAKHKGKVYPMSKMMEVLKILSQRPNTRILLFGGGAEESEALAQLERLFSNTVSCAGKLRLEDEMQLMGHLNVMVSMDSANMHIASLMGTPVVSVWGATHPYAGFLGWGQDEDNCVQVDMPCRPCSVFGNKKCRYTGTAEADDGTGKPCAYQCMNGIKPEKIVEIIEKNLD